MKCLKEPLSRLANRQDQARGAFFEGRFKSVAILDEQSLLAVCACIDLNPVAAGIAELASRSSRSRQPWTSGGEPLSWDLDRETRQLRCRPKKLATLST